MVKRVFYICVCLLLSLAVKGQDSLGFDVSLSTHQGVFTNNLTFDPGSNGASVNMGVAMPLFQKIDVRIGSELGSGGISNYFGIEAGILFHPIFKDNKLVLKFGLHTIHGGALFRNNPIYMFGFSEDNFLGVRLKNGSSLGLVLAFRAYSFPAYESFSAIYSFGDIQAGIRFYF